MTHSVDFSIIENNALKRGVSIDHVREVFHHKHLDTPMLLLSRSEIRRNYDAIKQALPRVNVHYAVKPNNHEAYIQEVFDRGGNFDVCSAGEIDLVLKTGIDPASLMHLSSDQIGARVRLRRR